MSDESIEVETRAGLLGPHGQEAPAPEDGDDLDGRHEAVAVAHPLPGGGGEDGGGGAAELLVGEGGEGGGGHG